MKLRLPNDQLKCNLLSIYIEKWIGLEFDLSISYSDSDLIWAGPDDSILLWPWDQTTHRVNKTTYAAIETSCRAAIYFNEFPSTASNSHIAYPAFYWARNPVLAELESSHWHSYNQRPILSSFIGRIENQTQALYRSGLGYEDVISDYALLSAGEQYPFSSNEYYDRLLRTKFSICPRGYGPKTHREIESFATGAVVLMNSSNHDFQNYYEPLIPFKHFVPYESASDIPRIIGEISPTDWEYISKNALSWYYRNCSFEGSFTILSNIVDAILEGP